MWLTVVAAGIGKSEGRLTSEQRYALCVLLLLFLVGLAVKSWRTAHPSFGSVAPPAKEDASR
jgi:hypothetical protein